MWAFLTRKDLLLASPSEGSSYTSDLKDSTETYFKLIQHMTLILLGSIQTQNTHHYINRRPRLQQGPVFQTVARLLRTHVKVFINRPGAAILWEVGRFSDQTLKVSALVS